MRMRTAAGCLLFGLACAAAAGAMAARANAQGGAARHDERGAAPDTLRITLRAAVLAALEHNPTLSIQRLAPAIAQSFVSQERASYDPALTFSLTRDESKSQRFLGSRPDPFELTSKRDQYRLGLSQALPTGTTLSIDALLDGSTSSIYKPQYSGNIGVTITQPLLRGFGPGAALASLRRARLDLEISRAELRGMAERLLADTEGAYWALYLAAEEREIQDESLRLASRQLDESLERVRVGKLAEIELAAVRAEVARREGALIDAESRYEQARLQLLYLLDAGEGTSWSTVPVPIDRPEVAGDTLEAVGVHEALALERRPDLEQARLERRKGELEVTRTRNGLLPRLDFFITLGRTTYARTFEDAIPDVESPFYNVNAGVSLDLPVPLRDARAQARRAAKAEEQLEYALRNMEQLARKDVRAAYIEVRRTRQQIEATRVTLELQRENLDAELEKFRVGRSTNLLVLQVQRDFTASRLECIRSVVDHLNALVQLYLTEGTLLERKGIAVPAEL